MYIYWLRPCIGVGRFLYFSVATEVHIFKAMTPFFGADEYTETSKAYNLHAAKAGASPCDRN